MKELKHKQKIDMEEIKQKRLNRYQRKQEEQRKNEELEHKHFMQGIAICCFVIAIIGSIFGLG